MHLHTSVLLCVPVFHYQLREKVKETLTHTLNNVQRIVLVLPHAVCRLFPQNDSGHLLSQTAPETHGPPLSASCSILTDCMHAEKSWDESYYSHARFSTHQITNKIQVQIPVDMDIHAAELPLSLAWTYS